MNAFKEFDDLEETLTKKVNPDDGKSMADIMREKREKTEKMLEGQPQPSKQESIEDRRARLKA